MNCLQIICQVFVMYIKYVCIKKICNGFVILLIFQCLTLHVHSFVQVNIKVFVCRCKSNNFDTARPKPLCKMCTVFILIEARRASAGILLSETVLISGENNYMYCDRDTTLPLYIFYKLSLLFDLFKQVRTKCNIFNCKVKQFQWFCQGHIAVKNGGVLLFGACF